MAGTHLKLFEVRETGNTEVTEDSLCKKRWRKLSSVFKVLFLLKHNSARKVWDLDELIEDVRSSPTLRGRSRSRSSTLDAIEEHRRNELLFEAIIRGGREDCVEIGRILDEDPKKYIRTRSDPDALQNRQNPKGFRPIYEASRYGHLDVVKLLHDYGADPRLLSNVDNGDVENALNVACRWGHLKIVSWLLQAVKWSKRELKDAVSICANNELQRLVRSRIPSSSWLGCCARK